MTDGDTATAPLRAAVLDDLVAALGAEGAWLVTADGRTVAAAPHSRVDLEAPAADAVRREAAAGTAAPSGARFETAPVADGFVLVIATATDSEAIAPALRLAATALAAAGTDVGDPAVLTGWLAEQPGPRSVFAVSIDELDAVTEAFGRRAGDAIVDAVTDRVDRWAGRSARVADTTLSHAVPMHLAARTDLDDIDTARHEAETLRALLSEPVELGSSAPGAPALVSRSVTVGVAVDERAHVSAAELVSSAQRALGAGRAAGGDQVAVFVADTARRRHDRLRLELELVDATHGEQLRLHYQPEYDLRTRRIVAVEALVRWQHPRLGLLSAERFVPGTEHTHAFTAVQRWVIEQTCEQLARWRRAGLAHRLGLRINAAAAQVLAGTITDALVTSTQRHGLHDADICIELTERMLPTDAVSLRRLAAVIAEWHERAVRVAVDDFGTGQGTYTHLLELPVDVLKLDQTYVRRLATDPRAHAIVANTVRLAGDLGIGTVVAEGVDTTTTAQRLLDLGVRHAQGNGLSPALPPAAVAELLRNPKPSRSGGSEHSTGGSQSGAVSSDSSAVGAS